MPRLRWHSVCHSKQRAEMFAEGLVVGALSVGWRVARPASPAEAELASRARTPKRGASDGAGRGRDVEDRG